MTDFAAKIAAGTSAIFHHHRLSQVLRELLSHETRDDIGNASRREGDLESNVFGSDRSAPPAGRASPARTRAANTKTRRLA